MSLDRFELDFEQLIDGVDPEELISTVMHMCELTPNPSPCPSPPPTPRPSSSPELVRPPEDKKSESDQRGQDKVSAIDRGLTEKESYNQTGQSQGNVQRILVSSAHRHSTAGRPMKFNGEMVILTEQSNLTKASLVGRQIYFKVLDPSKVEPAWERSRLEN